MNLRRRSALLTASALVVILASGAAWTTRPGADGLRPVHRADVLREVVSPGSVETAADQVALGFDIGGRIAEILVKEGERVEQGQLLARLDDRIATARVARAEAARQAAIARRDTLEHGSRPEEITAAAADVQAATAQVRDSENRHERAEKLLDSKAVSQAEADAARESRAAARATASAAKARYELVRRGARDEARREARAAVASAEAELMEARTHLSQTEMRAPRKGLILRRFLDAGEQVVMTPPKVVMTLADVDQLQIRVEVDEADVGKVQVGQAGFATAEAFSGRRFPGHIIRVLGDLGRKELKRDDPRARLDTRVLEAIFVLDQPELLPLGLRMDIHVATVAKKNVITAPLSALVLDGAPSKGGTAEVTVMVKGERVQRTVTLGEDDGVIAEITAGLQEGDILSQP